MLMLEEAPMETIDELVGLRLSKAVRQIKATRELNELMLLEGKPTQDFGFPDDLTDEEYEDAKRFFGEAPLYIYDHQGANEFNNVMQRVEYMAASLDCDVILVDHITALIAGMTDRGGTERESIDDIMRRLRSIVERTGVHLDVVSQLNRLQGKSAEEGGQISLNNLRGSGSLGSVPNNVIAIERDQQAMDPSERNVIKVRTLKGRFLGHTGLAGFLRFNPITRRLEEADWQEEIQDDNPGQTFTDPEGILDEEGAEAALRATVPDPGTEAGDDAPVQ